MSDGALGRQVSPGNGMRVFRGALGLLFFSVALLVPRAAAAGPAPAPSKLESQTLAAFNRYVRLTEARNDDELRRGSAFLWIEALPENERTAAHAELARGAVKMQRLETLDAGQAIACPDGMIHHWVGAVFIPGATLGEALALLQDYDHHAQYYAPDVERSRMESHDANHFRVFLRFRRHKVVTVVLDTEHDIFYMRDSATRAHSRSSAIRIAQVEDAGKTSEREKPVGNDDGYLWKMETWWRMEERDGGTYLQSESVSLTRTVPTGLGWLIGPFVSSIPRESLTFTLEATRRGVQSRRRSAAGDDASR